MSLILLQLSLCLAAVIQLTSLHSTDDVTAVQDNDLCNSGQTDHVLSALNQLATSVSQLQTGMTQLQTAVLQLQNDVTELKATIHREGKNHTKLERRKKLGPILVCC